ncbi:Uncharacterized protein MCHI_001557 [Candidatus Magnetoovum chiemensis]|nr:Uncharacterized protein MCHI_001557 [Candidatus Magnetoovum chiemensis]
MNSNLKLLAEDIARQFGCELFDISLKGQGRRKLLRMTIDKENGVTIDDCEEVSRQLSAVLDVENIIEGPYTIEVSSPGMDRPLRNKEDFIKHKGKLAKIVTKEQINNNNVFIGRLSDVVENNIILSISEQDSFTIDMDKISKAKLEIEIK